ncbi:TPA: Ig-like domain-containing protein [Streptococcus equi subsp. zooepidemicus]|uniref:MSCRAMM family protein n=1 Tax=Streptococcus equi TaxID=1336 RepID=UPI001E29DEA3|nr:Ig-like domain-containing protein [Streptococcus equi]MCD3395671.1 Ig-like domain-containing protein [Streptococcus equi subsp. zooepidemicus]MCD3449396.1 Ig-like domain-containing protein [Streptococcus equi subsp. zooepidemicus]MCD3459594.1 Ig-like domain-containing protein [Streptococcus equi subsp. zooepidemicus]MDI5903342.1 Ig-like domain-containing protein [Streptococcus equi subsp. zooepidemicus]MDI5932094.1 Ig-like domain-containing protein [Streptococcus equi subsp. zooepidemicus]
MKKQSLKKVSLLTVTVISSLALAANVNTYTTYARDNAVAATSQTAEGFDFVATILASNGHVLEGKTVVLSDTTANPAKQVASAVSNSDGQAIFTQLPLNRNLSVSVDGETKGYTVRTSLAGSKEAASFVAKGAGTKEPIYSKNVIDITVRNQDSEPLEGQTVTLKTRQGQLVGSLVSDKNGKVTFKDRLLDGTFYHYELNGKYIGQVMTKMSVNAYLDTSSSSSSGTSPQSKDTPKQEDGKASPLEEGFHFVVTALDKEDRVVAGKEVSLTALIDGARTTIASAKTNADGQAVFTKLPLSRNISVSIDGKLQGYTVRTSEPNEHKAAAFYVDGKGTKPVVYSKTPAIVTVYDANGNKLAGQEVVLKNRYGAIRAIGKTDQSGKATFVNQLMDGMLYDIVINGVKIPKKASTGSDVSGFLTKAQIRTGNKLSESERHSKDTKPLGKEPKDPEKDKNVAKPETKPSSSRNVAPKEGKKETKALPRSGEAAAPMVAFMGVLLIGLAAVIGLVTKRRSS